MKRPKKLLANTIKFVELGVKNIILVYKKNLKKTNIFLNNN